MSLTGSTKVKESIIGSIHKVKQIYGYSAYELAVKNGFNGTLEEWLNSLNGKDGLSAYELAVKKGFIGTLADWLESIKGEPGTLESHSELDALGHKVINVASPRTDTDVVTLGFLKKYIEVVKEFNYFTMAVEDGIIGIEIDGKPATADEYYILNVVDKSNPNLVCTPFTDDNGNWKVIIHDTRGDLYGGDTANLKGYYQYS